MAACRSRRQKQKAKAGRQRFKRHPHRSIHYPTQCGCRPRQSSHDQHMVWTTVVECRAGACLPCLMPAEHCYRLRESCACYVLPASWRSRLLTHPALAPSSRRRFPSSRTQTQPSRCWRCALLNRHAAAAVVGAGTAGMSMIVMMGGARYAPGCSDCGHHIGRRSDRRNGHRKHPLAQCDAH